MNKFLKKLDIYLISGAVQYFRDVEIIQEDDNHLQFWYQSQIDDTRHEAIFIKSALAGLACVNREEQ